MVWAFRPSHRPGLSNSWRLQTCFIHYLHRIYKMQKNRPELKNRPEAGYLTFERFDNVGLTKVETQRIWQRWFAATFLLSGHRRPTPSINRSWTAPRPRVPSSRASRQSSPPLATTHSSSMTTSTARLKPTRWPRCWHGRKRLEWTLVGGSSAHALKYFIDCMSIRIISSLCSRHRHDGTHDSRHPCGPLRPLFSPRLRVRLQVSRDQQRGAPQNHIWAGVLLLKCGPFSLNLQRASMILHTSW